LTVLTSLASPAALPRTGEGRACGTFGELLQGVLPGKRRHFLVTFPIAAFAAARFSPRHDLDHVHVWPSHKCKAQSLAQQLLAILALPPGGLLHIESELPEGKGLASSTADLVATARAIAACFGLALAPTMLERLLSEIEPSDGVMYSGVTAFYHREVRLLDRLGQLPPLTVVGLDEGGQVDTLAFNRRPTLIAERETHEYAALLDELTSAVARVDLAAVGRVATRSAVLNQRRLAKRTLDEVLDVCSGVGGLGVIATHSGTCIGILLETEGRHFREQFLRARDGLRRLDGQLVVYQSASG
jgi:uncharacterized protein involved in propanediol utilization